MFRRKHQLASRCAVRQDRPIPAFVRGETWDYGGTVRVGDAPPPGFRSEAATSATKQIGYYLFHALDG